LTHGRGLLIHSLAPSDSILLVLRPLVHTYRQTYVHIFKGLDLDLDTAQLDPPLFSCTFTNPSLLLLNYLFLPSYCTKKTPSCRISANSPKPKEAHYRRLTLRYVHSRAVYAALTAARPIQLALVSARARVVALPSLLTPRDPSLQASALLGIRLFPSSDSTYRIVSCASLLHPIEAFKRHFFSFPLVDLPTPVATTSRSSCQGSAKKLISSPLPKPQGPSTKLHPLPLCASLGCCHCPLRSCPSPPPWPSSAAMQTSTA
jgi:hypothetical protein